MLTETWLKPEILNSEVFPGMYTIYRFDRPSRRGGGVLIAVRSTLASEELLLDDSRNSEFVCVKLSFSDRSVYITCSYIPPSSEFPEYQNHLSAIQSILNKLSDRDQLVVLGDFNIPGTMWSPEKQSNILLPLAQHDFIDGLLDLSLSQVNYIPNSLGRLLDLCFVTSPESVFLSRVVPLTQPEDQYHPTFEVEIDLGTVLKVNSEKSTNRIPCFRKANFRRLNNFIAGFNWSDLYSCNIMADAINMFYTAIKSFFDSCVPMYYPSISKPPWFNKELTHLRNVKSRLYMKFKNTGSQSILCKYLSARLNFTVLNAQCYKNYLNRCKFQFAQDPKQFYNFVSTKRKTSSYPSSLFFENTTVTSDQAIADLFAKFFQTTYSTLPHSEQPYSYAVSKSNLIFCPTINESSLLNDLQRVKPVYSPGPDGIPGCVLRFCAEALCKPLLKLFTLSLESSQFPHIWKESFVIPLHKKGSKLDASNYRGISKLSAIPKLFENVITPHLQHLCRSIISPCQHGFMKRRSTTTNLLELTSFVIQGFKNNLQTDVIYTDFSKAFDSVNHYLLIKKLDLIGFPVDLLNWISSYLNGRTQQVLFKNSLSSILRVTSGVPQGSHLGPLLFTLFINDLPLIIKHSRVLMYADDVKLCLQYKDTSCHLDLQSDLDRFQIWCRDNILDLNSSKCKVMTFCRANPIRTTYTLSGCSLDRITRVDDLGVLLDPKLKFSDHISSIVNKARGVLGFIKRWSKEFDDPYLTKTLFISLVRPILEYGSPVWSPQYAVHSDRIESVQKNFLLFALRRLNWDANHILPPYSSRLLLINLPSLANRRTMLGTVFICKLIRGDVESPDLISRLNFSVPSRVTRNYIPLILNHCRSNYELHDPYRVLCSDYNRLYPIICNLDSLPLLKQSILSFLLHN